MNAAVIGVAPRGPPQAGADDARVRADLFGPTEKKAFAEAYCDRYEGSKWNNSETYVWRVDVCAKIKRPRRLVTG